MSNINLTLLDLKSKEGPLTIDAFTNGSETIERSVNHLINESKQHQGNDPSSKVRLGVVCDELKECQTLIQRLLDSKVPDTAEDSQGSQRVSRAISVLKKQNVEVDQKLCEIKIHQTFSKITADNPGSADTSGSSGHVMEFDLSGHKSYPS